MAILQNMGLIGDFAKPVEADHLPTLEAVKLFTEDGEVIKQRALRRVDPGGGHQTLSMISQQYVIMQPEEVVKIWERVIPQESKICMYGSGWMSIATRLPVINLDGDKIEMFMYLFNPFRSREGVHLFNSGTRAWCLNQIIAAMKEALDVITLHHNQDVHERLEAWLSGLWG